MPGNGANLLLAPQERALICDRALISFLKKNRTFKTKLEEEIIRLKELCTRIDIHVVVGICNAAPRMCGAVKDDEPPLMHTLTAL